MELYLNADIDFDKKEWHAIQTINFNNAKEMITKHIFTCTNTEKWFLEKVMKNRHAPLMYMYLKMNKKLRRDNSIVMSDQYRYLKDTGLLFSSEMFAMLIEDVDLNVNSADITGETILMLMACFGDKENCKLLIDKGANVNAVETIWGNTPLIEAVGSDDITYIEESYRIPVVKLLLTADYINMNAKGKKSNTAFEWAVKKEYPTIANLLRAAVGIDI